jgi:hypothetical protein
MCADVMPIRGQKVRNEPVNWRPSRVGKLQQGSNKMSVSSNVFLRSLPGILRLQSYRSIKILH